MLSAMLLITVAVLPLPGLFAVDRCERFEQNIYHDERGEVVFTQLIAFDDRHVAWWRMNKTGELNPVRENIAWVVRWNDQGVFREAWARSFDTTWTQYDPETADREYVPPEKRRGLKH